MTVKTKNEIEIVGRERLTPALEVAKNFVAKSFSRPALQHVALMPNGEMQATDSHVAIILKNVHSYSEEILLHPKTLDLVKGYNFPDINRLVSKDEPKAIIEFNRNNLIELLPALSFTKKIFNRGPKLTITNEEILLSEFKTNIAIKNYDETKAWKVITSDDTPIVATFDKKFLPLVFESFLKFSNLDTITAYYFNKMRPLIFENEDMQIIILPIRTYEPGENNG